MESPPYRRAIAYGKVAPILHLAGWIGSERQLSRSALDSVLFWVRFGGRVSTARRLALDPGEYNKGKTICDSPTLVGRAIAYGKVAPILHLAGWIGSERQLSRSALDSVLFWVRFGGRVSTARRLALDPGEYNKGKAICDSPALRGRGTDPTPQNAPAAAPRVCN